MLYIFVEYLKYIKMKNEIVHSINREVFTDSKIISEMLDVPHHHLLRTVDRIIKRQEKQPPRQNIVFSQKFIETTYTNKMGRSYKMYNLNEQAYMKLAMQLSNYEKAEIVQDAIIQAFSLMKQALLNHENSTWLNMRKDGKHIRAIETDTIKEFIEYATEQGSKSAKKYYMNITRMTNKALELLIQVKDNNPMREMATIQELGFIRVVEDRATESLKFGMNQNLPYKYIYKLAKEEVNKIVDALCFSPKSIS